MLNSKKKSLLTYRFYIIHLLLFCLSGCSKEQSLSVTTSDTVPEEPSFASTSSTSTDVAEIPDYHAKNILAIALDADGCVFNKDYIKDCRVLNCPKHKTLLLNVLDAEDKNHQEMLIQHNQKLLEHITNQIQKGDYDKILFLIASWRQYGDLDLLNAYKINNSGNTALFLETMPILVDYIKAKNQSLSDKIIFDHYLIPDTLEGCSPGDYYQGALEYYRHPLSDKKYICSKAMSAKVKDSFSKSKYIIVENHLAYLQKKFPKAAIHYRVYDDEPDLYDAYIEKNAPDNPINPVTIEVYKYNGGEEISCRFSRSDEDDDPASSEYSDSSSHEYSNSSSDEDNV